MKQDVAQQLVDLNREFYRKFAYHFAHSRFTPWYGFAPLAAHLPVDCDRFLDVGCGDGRLGRYLLQNERINAYIGVDYSSELIAEGRQKLVDPHMQARFQYAVRDLTAPAVLEEFGRFDGIASIAVLHHIPGRERRIALLQAMSDQLTENGRLIISTFQFMTSGRLRRKVLDWSTIGLSDNDVEPGDYLVDWKRGGAGLRYIAMLDAPAVADMVAATDLEQVAAYYSDGKEGNLNLYVVLKHRS